MMTRMMREKNKGRETVKRKRILVVLPVGRRRRTSLISESEERIVEESKGAKNVKRGRYAA